MTACACEHCGHEFESEPSGHRLLCGDAEKDGRAAVLADDGRTFDEIAQARGVPT